MYYFYIDFIHKKCVVAISVDGFIWALSALFRRFGLYTVFFVSYFIVSLNWLLDLLQFSLATEKAPLSFSKISIKYPAISIQVIIYDYFINYEISNNLPQKTHKFRSKNCFFTLRLFHWLSFHLKIILKRFKLLILPMIFF